MTAGRSIAELVDLTGRVALITGGGGNIGAACAHALAELGAHVVLADVDAAGLDARSAELRNNSASDVRSVVVDLADTSATRQAVENVVSEAGRLDILVNCAAFVGTSKLDGWAVPPEQQSPDLWPDVLAVNLTAAFITIQSATQALRASGRGSVINVASIYGMAGPDHRLYEGTEMGNPAGYAASKGGLIQLTRWAATALAPDVRVNTISPGGIERGQPESFRRRYADRTPLRRLGTEEDLKGAFAFLASDLSAYVTGHNLVVDGGWTAW